MRKGHLKIIEKLAKRGYGQSVINYFESREESLNVLQDMLWFLSCLNTKDLESATPEVVQMIFEMRNELDGMFGKNYYWMHDLYYYDSKEKKMIRTSVAEFQKYFGMIKNRPQENRKVYSSIFGLFCNVDATYEIVGQLVPPSALDRYGAAVDYLYDYDGRKNIGLIIPYANYYAEHVELDKKIFQSMNIFCKAGVSLNIAQKYSFDYQKLYRDSIGPFMPLFYKEKECAFIETPKYSEEEIENLAKAAKGAVITVESPSFGFFGAYNNNGTVNMNFKKTNSFFVTKSQESSNCKPKLTQPTNMRTVSAKLVFFGNTNTLMREVKKRLIPASIKDLCMLAVTYGNLFTKILFPWVKHQSRRFPFFKDILKLINSCCHTGDYRYVPAISLKECESYTNWNQAMNAHYKRKLGVNWNKYDIRTLFFIYKTIPKVTEGSKKVLLSCANMEYSSRSLNLQSILFDRLPKKTYWKVDKADDDGNLMGEKVQVSEQEVKDYIDDYITMSHQLHRKVSLTFKSASKLKAAHDDLAVTIRNKHTPLIKIPKNTVFKDLEKLLPADEFSWIKTRQRIIKESAEMHNCVASYAEGVNKDICAIYSFISKTTNTRYTVEFRRTGGRYVLKQIQAYRNRGYVKKDKEYISKLLNEKAAG